VTEQWDFVVAAYALTALLTALVLGGSWRAMTRAEKRADALRRDAS
jgi:hypothetical protein